MKKHEPRVPASRASMCGSGSTAGRFAPSRAVVFCSSLNCVSSIFCSFVDLCLRRIIGTYAISFLFFAVHYNFITEKDAWYHLYDLSFHKMDGYMQPLDCTVQDDNDDSTMSPIKPDKAVTAGKFSVTKIPSFGKRCKIRVARFLFTFNLPSLI